MVERLEIDALRALRAIRAHGGVTKAASHLGLSQSAVSHKIKRLEAALDCTLLARQAGGPLFTDAGARLHDYAVRITNLSRFRLIHRRSLWKWSRQLLLRRPEPPC